MYITAIIPARGDSKRIPKKNIISFAGRPLIEYSIEHARKSKLVNRVIVSTDDQEIERTSLLCGAEVIMRPEEISVDTASSESALLHVLNCLEEQERACLDLIVFLQCTSPLRNDDDIDNAIDFLLRENADSLFSACKFNKCIWKVQNGLPVSFNYDYKNRQREQDFPLQFQENGSIYVFKPAVLKKEKNRLGGKIVIFEMNPLHSFQIDSYEDLAICEHILKLYGSQSNV